MEIYTTQYTAVMCNNNTWGLLCNLKLSILDVPLWSKSSSFCARLMQKSNITPYYTIIHENKRYIRHFDSQDAMSITCCFLSTAILRAESWWISTVWYVVTNWNWTTYCLHMIANALFLENAKETSHSWHGKYPEYETSDLKCICAISKDWYVVIAKLF